MCTHCCMWGHEVAMCNDMQTDFSGNRVPIPGKGKGKAKRRIEIPNPSMLYREHRKLALSFFVLVNRLPPGVSEDGLLSLAFEEEIREVAEGMTNILRDKFRGHVNDFVDYWMNDKAAFLTRDVRGAGVAGKVRPVTPEKKEPVRHVQEQKELPKEEEPYSGTGWGSWSGWKDNSRTEGGSSGSGRAVQQTAWISSAGGWSSSGGWDKPRDSAWPVVPTPADEAKGKRKATDLDLTKEQIEKLEQLGLLKEFTPEEKKALAGKARFTEAVASGKKEAPKEIVQVPFHRDMTPAEFREKILCPQHGG